MDIKLSDHFTYKRLFRFVIPSIAMMIFISIYGVVDGFFVSNFVGKTEFAAVNLIMPFPMLLGAFGFMIGTGGSALVSMTLGQGKKERANEIVCSWNSIYQTDCNIYGCRRRTFGLLCAVWTLASCGADTVYVTECISKFYGYSGKTNLWTSHNNICRFGKCCARLCSCQSFARRSRRGSIGYRT